MSAVSEIAPGKLQVSGELTFNTVLAIRIQGEALILKGPESIEVDFSGVSNSGSPVVSLMMCWLRVASESDRKICYTGMPDILQGIIDVSGLAEHFSLVNGQK